MTIRNLEALFRPASLAVVGPDRFGGEVPKLLLSRLAGGGFSGEMATVACPAEEGSRIRAVGTIAELPFAPDLALYLGRPENAPAAVAALGAAGTRAVAALSPGYDRWDEATVTATLQAARPHTLRLLGPGSLGIAAPAAGLAAHLGVCEAGKGDLAFIARSGTVVNATLSWAKANGIGFSAIASLGQRTDVDVSDLLDWFALDYRTRAILVHLETIANPRKFLSAARVAARSKPVVVLRSGASRERIGERVTHAGRIAMQDAVYDAALARAGVLRVGDIDEMFEAVETVSRVKPVAGRRLAILATGGSLATLAADQLERQGGQLADLDDGTAGQLAPLRREGQSRANPLTLHETSPPARYGEAAKVLLTDPNVDAVLAVAAPSAFVNLEEIAGELAKAHGETQSGYGRRKPLLVALAAGAPLPRQPLDAARIPCHGSASEAVRSFMHLVRYADAREMLMAAPPSLPAGFTTDSESARRLVRGALDSGRTWLTPGEIAELLSCYGIKQAPGKLAATPDEAEVLARGMLMQAERLALKLVSPQLPFKSDVGGVVLDLASPEAVRIAAATLLERIGTAHPAAEITGILLQPMVRSASGTEIFIGLADDPGFGPVLLFGHGGTGVEVMGDVALALPPLDLNLAQALIRQTRVSRLLAGFRNRPAADLDAIALTLVKVAQIAVDLPEVRELDLNPLVADAAGVTALDARIALREPEVHRGRHPTSRLAIAPYPKEWEKQLQLKDGSTVDIRPVRPEDEERYRRFFENVSPHDLRLRFFAPVKEFNHAFMQRLVQLDYSRAMAFAALTPGTDEILGVVRLHADPDHRTGEYAIIVQSDLKGRGLGWALMQLIIDYARSDGIETITGEVLKENTTMLAMCTALGFTVKSSVDDDAIAKVTLPVASASQGA